MNLTQYAHDHLVKGVTSLSKGPEDKWLPPAFSFVSGVNDGYMTDLLIYKFTSLDNRDMSLVPTLLRLLVVKASLSLHKEQAHDVRACCFFPFAFSPKEQVVGAEILFTPESVRYRHYTLSQKPEGINLTISLKDQALGDSPEALQTVINRMNPFMFLKLSDEGMMAAFSPVLLPDGPYLTGASGNVDDDIYKIAGGIGHSVVEVTP
jgi:hypothetical protein